MDPPIELPSLTGLPLNWVVIFTGANIVASLLFGWGVPAFIKWRTQRMAEKKQDHETSAADRQLSDERSDKVYQYVIQQLTQQLEELRREFDKSDAERKAERLEYNAKLIALNHDHLECVKNYAAVKAQNDLLIQEQLRMRASAEDMAKEVADMRAQVGRLWKHDEANKQHVDALRSELDKKQND